MGVAFDYEVEVFENGNWSVLKEENRWRFDGAFYRKEGWREFFEMLNKGIPDGVTPEGYEAATSYPGNGWIELNRLAAIIETLECINERVTYINETDAAYDEDNYYKITEYEHYPFPEENKECVRSLFKRCNLPTRIVFGFS